MANMQQNKTKIMEDPLQFCKKFLYEVDDSFESVAVIESVKEKHARIANMFLARPAPEEVRQEFERYFQRMSKKKGKKRGGIKNVKKMNVKKTEEEKGDKKKEKTDKKGNDKNSEEKQFKKIVSRDKTTDILEEKRTATDIEMTDGHPRNPWIAFCNYLRSWYANKKEHLKVRKEANLIEQQQQRKKMKKIKGARAAYYLDDETDGDLLARMTTMLLLTN